MTHPIQADAWLLGGLGFGADPDHRQISHFPTCSLDHRGASGPRLVVHEPPLDIFFLGEEDITIEAGLLLPCISVMAIPLLIPRAVIRREVILGIMYGPRPTAILLC